jgi:hypothetical protein
MLYPTAFAGGQVGCRFGQFVNCPYGLDCLPYSACGTTKDENGCAPVGRILPAMAVHDPFPSLRWRPEPGKGRRLDHGIGGCDGVGHESAGDRATALTMLQKTSQGGTSYRKSPTWRPLSSAGAQQPAWYPVQPQIVSQKSRRGAWPAHTYPGAPACPS